MIKRYLSLWVVLALSLWQGSVRADEPQKPLYYYNGPAQTIAVYKDGSATITYACAFVRIPKGEWNTEGKEMKAVETSGPISSLKTEVTLTAVRLHSHQGGHGNSIALTSSSAPPVILNKAKQPAHFMICL